MTQRQRRSDAPHSGQLRVIQDRWGGACYEICAGEVCLRDRDGARIMARYREELQRQGLQAA